MSLKYLVFCCLVMDVLMTEATDLILSNNNKPSKDLNNAFEWERRKSLPELTDGSSITLLRMSIAKSLKERSQSEAIDSFSAKRRKNRRRGGSFSGKAKSDIQLLDSKIEATNSNERNQNISDEEENKLDMPESDNILTNLFTEECNSDEPVQSQPVINQTDANEDVANNYSIIPNEKGTLVHHNPVEIGLKLAQRQFSDRIFENCSTYSLTSPEVFQERKNSSSPKPHSGNASKFSSDKTSDSDILYRGLSADTDDGKVENTDNDNYSDDQIHLTDSFFANVNNSDENVNQNSLLSKDGDSSPMSKRSSMFAISKENRFFVPKETKFDAETLQLKSERKLNKKERKRQKKSKSNNDVPRYDCPKCKVSYILSNNASRTAARCLHCDFWKSVEPVFLKREKQPWNTCRIC